MSRKTNGRKSKKTGIYNDMSNQRRWNFALRFKTFDRPPYGKESSCSFKSILEGYFSAKTGYRLPNVHTLHNQVHIVLGGAVGDVSSASNDPVFPLDHSFVDRIRLRNGFASSTRALRFLEHTMHARIGHNKADDVIVPLYAVYTHQQIFKKSFYRVRLWLRRCRREW